MHLRFFDGSHKALPVNAFTSANFLASQPPQVPSAYTISDLRSQFVSTPPNTTRSPVVIDIDSPPRLSSASGPFNSAGAFPIASNSAHATKATSPSEAAHHVAGFAAAAPAFRRLSSDLTQSDDRRPPAASPNLFSPITAFQSDANATLKFPAPPPSGICSSTKFPASSCQPASALASSKSSSSPSGFFGGITPKASFATVFSKAAGTPMPQTNFESIGTFVVGAYSLQTLNSSDLPIGLPLRVLRDEVRSISEKQSFSNKLKFGKKPDSIVRLASQRHGAFGRIVTGIARHLSFLLDMKLVSCTAHVSQRPLIIDASHEFEISLTLFVSNACISDRAIESSVHKKERSPDEVIAQQQLVNLLRALGLRPHLCGAAFDSQSFFPSSSIPSPTAITTTASASINDQPEDEVCDEQIDGLMSAVEARMAAIPHAAQPPLLRSHLRPYQLQALHWMSDREKQLDPSGLIHPMWAEVSLPERSIFVHSLGDRVSWERPLPQAEPRGGILSDEMGLGKTVCILALISSEFEPIHDEKPAGACENMPPKTPATLSRSSFSQKPSPCTPMEAKAASSEAFMGHELHSDISFGAKRGADDSASSESKKPCMAPTAGTLSEAIDDRARADWVSSLTESEQGIVKMLLDGLSEFVPSIRGQFIPVSSTSNASLQRALDLHQRCANVHCVMKVPELRAELKALNMDPSGFKEDLKQRLIKKFQDDGSEVDAAEAAKAAESARVAAESAASKAADPWSYYSSQPVTQLKRLLTDRGMKPKGNKADIVAMLVSDDHDQAASSSGGKASEPSEAVVSSKYFVSVPQEAVAEAPDLPCALVDLTTSPLVQPSLSSPLQRLGSAAAMAARRAGCGPTLIITPMTILDQWQHEITTHCAPGLFKVCVYYGNARDAKEMQGADIVLSTYGVVSSDYDKTGPLFKMNWHRVVLDEAHNIRSRLTLMAKSCFALQSKMRWAVTGTPVQNRLGSLNSSSPHFTNTIEACNALRFSSFPHYFTDDLFSLLHFIRKPVWEVRCLLVMLFAEASSYSF